ncbi:peptide-methionine (S)-S-oxide reductase [Fontimonas thermophila]|uniref:Peptide methionine sulfoxide reductase MsrA n=1 Tax=Fontimonas thermophila TaxID=1076937 RepID=A0A1I2IA13_9GAMM|nr:peptide-methionine (S)-S-oxide reductase MsrA [Fontimonas thermophila]SFF39152.1 peptide-methionine (S)-S-oxide reductase [Fontimonas thermophila]
MSLFSKSRGEDHPLTPAEFPDPDLDIGVDAGARQSAVLAGGCFWCVETVFRQLDGVLDVVSGYAGDSAQTADYKTVCSGVTNHAEVVRVEFDAAKISYGQLLKVFFSVAHDPTHLNRQGNDVGRQYRSAVFYADDAQREVAERYIRKLEAAKAFAAPIVTSLERLEAFHKAEDYHQDYAARNPGQPYIRAVALPKREKVRHYFADRLKPQ